MPDVNDVIRYLREREIVHYQRFGEGLRRTLEKLDQKNIYAVNPAFDRVGPDCPDFPGQFLCYNNLIYKRAEM